MAYPASKGFNNLTAYDKDSLISSLDYVNSCCEHLFQNDGDVDRLFEDLSIPAVEHSITKIATLLCALRTSRNRKLAVNILPPEILGYVFGFATKPTGHLPLSTNPIDSSHPHAFASVCRYWRQVAIDTPYLWHFIDLASVRCEFYESSLQRSVASPLTVYCNANTRTLDRQAPLFADVASQLHRVRDLRLLNGGPLSNIPLTIFGSDAPQLQRLVVQASTGTEVTALLDGWQTPRLQDLMLVGFACQWINNTWTNLRCLCVGECYFPVEVAQRFLAVLVSTSSSLEELVLFELGIPRNPASWLSKSFDDIRLPNLKRLVLRAHDLRLFDVLSTRLILPDGCAQQISTFYAIQFSDIIQRSSCYKPERFLIAGQHRVGVRGSSAYYIDNHSFDLESAATTLPVTSVKELWLSEGFIWADEGELIWRDVFGRMKDVRTLVLMDGFVVRSYKTNFLAYAFPRLEELHIHQYVSLFELKLLHEFLERRRGAGWTMPTISVYMGPNRPQEIETSWTRWVEDDAPDLSVTVNIVVGDERGPPQMEIPKVCQVRSSLHNFWHPVWWRGRPR